MTTRTDPLATLSTPDANSSPEYRLLYEHLHGVCGAADIDVALTKIQQEIERVREKLGISSPCRYALWDFDARTLVGGLYEDYAEAAADANRLDNAIILTIPWDEPSESAGVELMVSVAPTATPHQITELEAAVGATAVNVKPYAGQLDVLFIFPDGSSAEAAADKADGLPFVQSTVIGE